MNATHHRPSCIRVILIVFGLITFASNQSALGEPPSDQNLLKLVRSIELHVEKTPRPLSIEKAKKHDHQLQTTIQKLSSIPNISKRLTALLGRKLDYTTACSAAFALYSVDQTQAEVALERLLDQIRQFGFADTSFAESLIIRMGQQGVPHLVKHIDESMAIDLLGRLGSDAEAAVPNLKSILGSNNVQVARALAHIGTPDGQEAAKPILLAALKDLSSPETANVVIALGKMTNFSDEVIPEIRTALQSTNPDIKLYAALSLADLGETETAVAALGESIENQNLHNRYLAFAKLEALGTAAKTAVPALTNVLATHRSEEGVWAYSALDRIDKDNIEFKRALQEAKKSKSFRQLLKKEGLVK